MSTLFRSDDTFSPFYPIYFSIFVHFASLPARSQYFMLSPASAWMPTFKLILFTIILAAVNSPSCHFYDKRIVKLNIYIHLQRRDNILDNEKNRAGPTHSWLFILRDDGPRHFNFKTLTAWHTLRVLCWGNWLNSSVILICTFFIMSLKGWRVWGFSVAIDAILEFPEFEATKTACYLLISSRLIHHRLLFPPPLSTEGTDNLMISPLVQISTDRGQIKVKLVINRNREKWR